MLRRSIISWCAYAYVSGHRSRTFSPDWRWRIPVKTMILAAVAALSMGVGAAYAAGNQVAAAPSTKRALLRCGFVVDRGNFSDRVGKCHAYSF
jgi:hypothetical protein